MGENYMNISKDRMPVLPPCFRETKLGWPKKSVRQYRCGRLHAREYEDCFEIHVDRRDPAADPIGHLIYDAPEVLAALGVGGVSAAATAGIAYKITGSKLLAATAAALMGSAAAYAGKAGYESLRKK